MTHGFKSARGRVPKYQSGLIPRPFNNSKILFGNNEARTHLEIGAGDGQFAYNFSRAHQDVNFIAIERTLTRWRQFHEKFPDAAELTNLRYLRDDGERWVVHQLSADSLSKIYFLYPNPHLKLKHSNLRWHRRPFMELLLDKLKRGGQIVLRTNIEGYFREAARDYREIWGLNIVDSRSLVDEDTVCTRFERKYRERLENCFQLIVEKV